MSRGRTADRVTPAGLRPPGGGDVLPTLWVSNAPWSSTGYGQQTALFAPKMRSLGLDLSIFAFFGIEGGVLGWDGISVLPRFVHPYGNDIIDAHAKRTFGDKQGMIFTLLDVWVLETETYAKYPVVSWVPIDHDPAQPPTVRWLKATGSVPIAMSKFGQQALESEGFDALYVPHAFDPAVYRPQDQKESRAKVGLPEDAFIVGMVAANKGNSPPRKSFAECLSAFKAFHATHPDAVLYLHTEAEGVWQGVNLPEIARSLDLPKDAVIFADQYQYIVGFPTAYMAYAYSAMDVFLNPSYGEGFGIPIIEAQGCGTPVIVGDHTAMPELCGSGWTVESDPYWTQLGSWQYRPRIDSIVDRLERAYLDAAGMRAEARRWSLTYSVDGVLKRNFAPALARAKERLAL